MILIVGTEAERATVFAAVDAVDCLGMQQLAWSYAQGRGYIQRLLPRGELQAVVLADRLHKTQPEIFGFVTELRRTGWAGPIIVLTNRWSYRDQLLAAGCTDTCATYGMQRLRRLLQDA